MISVIIPAYNDEGIIRSTIEYLKQNAYTRLLHEIIVVDGGSSDRTIIEAKKAGARVVRSNVNNKSLQMNLGSETAKGSILYFLAPGIYPPQNFTTEIVRATMKGYAAGTFLLKYDINHWLLKGISWLAKFKDFFTGIDHQSLFVLRDLFVKAGSFRENHLPFEDDEIIKRLKRYCDFVTLSDKILTSTKRYLASDFIRQELAFLTARFILSIGVSPKRAAKFYRTFHSDQTSATDSSNKSALGTMQPAT